MVLTTCFLKPKYLSEPPSTDPQPRAPGPSTGAVVVASRRGWCLSERSRGEQYAGARGGHGEPGH